MKTVIWVQHSRNVDEIGNIFVSNGLVNLIVQIKGFQMKKQPTDNDTDQHNSRHHQQQESHNHKQTITTIIISREHRMLQKEKVFALFNF